MKCPECHTKITAKHYDPDFQWYECPKCEGCFTADEIEEAENGTSPAKRARQAAGKQMGKVDSPRAGSRRTSIVSDGNSSKPLAKAKKKQKEIQEDLEAVAKKEKEWLKPVETDEPEVKKHRDEISTRQVVNIMADEIQAFYEELGGEIDEVNAQEKALIIWRQLRIDTGISAREQDVPFVACVDHA